MTSPTLSRLKAERSVLDKRIRGARVQQIRSEAAVRTLSEPTKHLLAEMDRRLLAVHYDAIDFDDLLDQIEDRLA